MKRTLLLGTFILLWTVAWANESGIRNRGSFPCIEINSYSPFDQGRINGVELYPNPVTEGRLTITASDNILSVRVLNITGKIVFDQEYQSGITSVEIELSKLERGIYLVRVSLEGRDPYTQKIMIK